MARPPWRIPGLGGAVVLGAVGLSALAAPLLAPHDPFHQDLLFRLMPPGTAAHGATFLLGTDSLGRDVLSRIIYGARVSLTVAFVAVAMAGVAGVLAGIASAYYRGAVDAVLMRLADVILSVPFLLLAIATVAVLGPSFTNLILVLGCTRWPRYARVTYAQTLAVREQEFVHAERALGASDARILARHLLPNVLSPIIVVATLEVGLMIIFEAALSFLGLGVQPPAPSWGGMLSEGREYLATAWWLATFPGLAIMLTVLAANLVGDGAREALDPRARSGLVT